MSSIIRYIVYINNINDNDNPIQVSYNTALGKNDALKFAKITASRYFGGIVSEDSEGNFKEVKNYYKEKR